MPKPAPRACRICGEEFTPAIKHTVTLCPKTSCRAADRRRANGQMERQALIVDGKKQCSKCQEWKPVDQYAVRNNRRNAVHSACKPCLAERARTFGASERGRHLRYLRTYGVSLEWYNAKLAEQGGGCAICGDTDPGAGMKNLLVDHCHKDGTARGLLCWACNTALGKFKDDPELLRRAAAYVEADRAALSA